jgi:hypothetical protein
VTDVLFQTLTIPFYTAAFTPRWAKWLAQAQLYSLWRGDGKKQSAFGLPQNSCNASTGSWMLLCAVSCKSSTYCLSEKGKCEEEERERERL